MTDIEQTTTYVFPNDDTEGWRDSPWMTGFEHKPVRVGDRRNIIMNSLEHALDDGLSRYIRVKAGCCRTQFERELSRSTQVRDLCSTLPKDDPVRLRLQEIFGFANKDIIPESDRLRISESYESLHELVRRNHK
ncbi:MAG TPA: hypothetical protein VEA16_08835 [Vicinamibacterales bacterium]|nr:hypothetical protein [Vicinamibacterales bacterium]